MTPRTIAITSSIAIVLAACEAEGPAALPPLEPVEAAAVQAVEAALVIDSILDQRAENGETVDSREIATRLRLGGLIPDAVASLTGSAITYTRLDGMSGVLPLARRGDTRVFPEPAEGGGGPLLQAQGEAATSTLTAPLSAVPISDENLPGSARALILAPFQNSRRGSIEGKAWSEQGFRDDLSTYRSLLQDAGYSVDVHTNDDASVERFRGARLAEYGVVVIASHGAVLNEAVGQETFLGTGTPAEPYSLKTLLSTGVDPSWFAFSNNTAWIGTRFLRETMAGNRFDGTVFVLATCESSLLRTGQGSLVETLLNLGAGAVVSWDHVVGNFTAKVATEEVLRSLAVGSTVDGAVDETKNSPLRAMIQATFIVNLFIDKPLSSVLDLRATQSPDVASTILRPSPTNRVLAMRVVDASTGEAVVGADVLIVDAPNQTYIYGVGATSNTGLFMRNVDWGDDLPSSFYFSATATGYVPGGRVAAVSRGGSLTSVVYPLARMSTPLAAHIEIVSGNNQIANQGQLLPRPVIVRVLDQNGQPVGGFPLRPRYNNFGMSVSPEVPITDAAGMASFAIRAGVGDGLNQPQFRFSGDRCEPEAICTVWVQAYFPPPANIPDYTLKPYADDLPTICIEDEYLKLACAFRVVDLGTGAPLGSYIPPTRVYLSCDGQLDPSDWLLFETTRSVVFPSAEQDVRWSTFPQGRYRLIYQVNPGGDFELSLVNNVRVEVIEKTSGQSAEYPCPDTPTLPQVDVAVDVVSARGSAPLGEPLEFSLTISNRGQQRIESVDVSLMLCTAQSFSGTCRILDGVGQPSDGVTASVVVNLEAGQSRVIQVSGLVRRSHPLGTFYPGAILNALGRLSENVFSNNTAWSSVPITVVP